MSDGTITNESSMQEECMEELNAVMNCSFSAVRKKQISIHRGEKVKILSIDKKGYAKVVKNDGTKGYIPTYFLDLNTVPGDNFAQQIRYRRKWYHLVDSGQAIIFNNNPSNLLNNISYLTDLLSFLPVKKESFSLVFSSSSDKQPICIEPLQDLKIKLGEKIILMCKFFSEESYTITWRGPVITAKRQYEITTKEEEGYSMLTVEKCVEEDSGQYWVQAENIFGKCHTVAWITIIVPPGLTYITTCKAINRNSVLLQWKNARKGNSKKVYYVVEYKRKGVINYKVAMEGIIGTSTVITDLKSISYSFRIYAFNEYFKGKPGPIANVDLSMALSLSSIISIDDINAKTKYIDEATYAEIYTNSRVVYKGRFAVVKEIIRKNDKKQYAAKCFMRQFTQSTTEWENIEREVNIMRCVRHRNIVICRSVVKMNNQLIIIMQWLNGPHLLDYIIRLGYISEVLIQRFCKDLLLALEYLHSFKIAHLAIQPENLLTHISNAVRLVLIDFGSSRCDEEIAVWNCVTIDFASPEQISHSKITTKSDMWSFGIILYTLTTGTTPFDDEYYEVIRLKILSNISTIDEITNYQIHSDAIIMILKSVIIDDASARLSATECLKSKWMQNHGSEELFLVDYLEDYNERRKKQLQRIAGD